MARDVSNVGGARGLPAHDVELQGSIICVLVASGDGGEFAPRGHAVTMRDDVWCDLKRGCEWNISGNP